MPEFTRFTLLPSPRCCEITSSSPLVICNRPAIWMPRLSTIDVTPFWCDEHKKPDATIAAGVVIARRVSITSQIVLASAVRLDLLARAEALARFDRGVRAIGGLVNLHSVTCQTGSWALQQRQGDENGRGGGG